MPSTEELEKLQKSQAECISQLGEQIKDLHATLESRGINSRNAVDVFGRTFDTCVDAEHKAKFLNLNKFSNPFSRGFWASTIGFFSTFFSTFAAAPLMVYIKQPAPNGLGLSKQEIGLSGVFSVAGTIVMRLVTGLICDKFGARKGMAFLLLLGVPGVIGIAFTTNAAGFIVCRCIIGLSLAAFVACQVWCSQLFAKSIVGAVNATAGGWGNLGGGITNLLMPFIFLGFMSATAEDINMSWRLCYIVPLAMHLGAAALVLTGRDLPDGNYSELELSGAKQKSKGSLVVKIGVSNVNAYILTLTYGFCFGVELTMTNVAALYFSDYHGMNPQIAGVLASCFGLMNLFARSLGGIMSDQANARFGMRGRLWALWLVQMVEGALCIVMASVTMNMDAPDDSVEVNGAVVIDGVTYTIYNNSAGIIESCGSKQINYDTIAESIVLPGWVKEPSKVMLGDMSNPNCIRNQNVVGLVVIIMILFSIGVQMAEGLHYGVVPYVSRPALGIVSGMVGAGGNLGAVISQSAFFRNPLMRTDFGILYLGITVIATSFTMLFIYFPEHGSILFPPGFLGSYSPQLFKPPDDYRGADQMSYDNVNTTSSSNQTKEETKA